MKRVFLTLLLFLASTSILFAQKQLQGFSNTIVIDGTEYYVSDAPTVLDYKYIAKKDVFKTILGKFPAYGVIDKDNKIIILCKYSSLLPQVDKGVFFVTESSKNMLRSSQLIVDFNGNVVADNIPIGHANDPWRNVCEAYEHLPTSIKDACVNSVNTEYSMVASNVPQTNTQPTYNNNNYNNTTTAPAMRNSDVDKNIPVTNKKADNTFVLVIANENYEFVDDVQFALNDGETFREYCIKTLGVPERQVWLYKDATAGIIAGGVDKMLQAMSIFDNCNVIVYYCGHGIPDESTGDAYIIPTDGKGTNTATCYSLNKLYKTLASVNAKSVTYFMDACFTGANRDGSMLVAARGVAREAKKEVISGNTVVFSAASGDETAMPFKEKQHGLFTYFLLKKLQETKGNVTYGELAEYIKDNVRKEAFLTNEKPQNPVVATSAASTATWKTMKF